MLPYYGGKWTYLTSSSVFATCSWEPKSSFKIPAFTRVNPVPTTSQLCLWNALTTCLPSRPVAPVTRAVLVIVVVLTVPLWTAISVLQPCHSLIKVPSHRRVFPAWRDQITFKLGDKIKIMSFGWLSTCVFFFTAVSRG